METVMDLCRICDRPASQTRDIFSKNADGKQILQLIRETLPVVIYRNDPLSKRICTNCLEDVTRINSFRRNCLNVVNAQKDRLRNGGENVRLYLELLANTDEQELWMYSSPVKKCFEKETLLCIDCKTVLSTPKPQKPFKKYKEAVRKTDSDVVSINGYDLDEYEENGIGKKRKRLSLIDKSTIIGDFYPKRPKIIGPKSITQPFVKTTYVEADVYNPKSLLNLTLNVINSVIVPGVKSQHYDREVSIVEETEYICEYCEEVFTDCNDLAIHEVEHIEVRLSRVDDLELWNDSFEEAGIRNKWLREVYDDDFVFEEDEDDLLMPLVEIGDETIAEIELIDRKPMVNGVLLSDIPKADRKLYYNKNYVVSGVKRKFCPLCRYTFKDNWAIELHYFSNACYYTCRYCGVRYNKQRAQFEDHVNEHIERGEKIADRVYASRKKNDPIPRVLNEGRTTRSAESPKVKPLKMKQLFEKSNISSSPSPEKSGQSQAYFCRKCYKVFFKLDEFNEHTTVCTGVVQTEEVMESEEKFEPKRKYQRTSTSSVHETPPQHVVTPSGVTVSSTGRPVRNCVRDVKYKDHLDIGVEREDRPETSPAKGFECVICKAVFPTIMSRNSHMRIHRNGGGVEQEHTPKSYYNNYKEPSYSRYEDVAIKQEPLEPLVEIHGSSSSHDMPSSIGAVSITPIPNKRHKTAINPDIMRLVQSNPNITIRSMQQAIEPETLLSENPMDDGIRSYKCSSCSKAFTNKSNLYFHKKNHCEGSRYPCPFCKKRFGTETAYSSHIFYSHPE